MFSKKQILNFFLQTDEQNSLIGRLYPERSSEFNRFKKKLEIVNCLFTNKAHRSSYELV